MHHTNNPQQKRLPPRLSDPVSRRFLSALRRSQPLRPASHLCLRVPFLNPGREVEPDPSDDISGHSQLVHLVLRPLNVWGINCSRPRDAVLLQHWRLEEGTYLMTFTSMPKYDRKARE